MRTFVGGSHPFGEPQSDQLIAERLAAAGLLVRGSLDFAPGEAAPPGPDGAPARSVLLIGNAGAAHWPHFQRWLAAQPSGLRDPLDNWSRAVIGAIADDIGARAVSPSNRPYLPFQQWAMRAEGLKPSPLGILMHPDYGLWHAYRGALLFDHPLDANIPPEVNHLCDGCAGKPCRKSCPIDAHVQAEFAYADCLDHVRSDAGTACRTQGCFDRNACPYGTDFRYPPEVQAFHMKAFAGLQPLACWIAP